MSHVEEIRAMLQFRQETAVGDEERLRRAEEQLTELLQNASGEDAETVALVRSFIGQDEVQKRKLLLYFMGLPDPAAPPETTAGGEQICRHAYLKQHELTRLQQYIGQYKNAPSFGQVVFRLIDEHGMTPSQVYNNARMRRQDFSRVANMAAGRHVTRRMAWQIIIGLHCTPEEANDVMFSAGYTLGTGKLDLIMQYFIEKGEYDTTVIDAALYDLGMEPFFCGKEPSAGTGGDRQTQE